MTACGPMRATALTRSDSNPRGQSLPSMLTTLHTARAAREIDHHFQAHYRCLRLRVSSTASSLTGCRDPSPHLCSVSVLAIEPSPKPPLGGFRVTEDMPSKGLCDPSLPLASHPCVNCPSCEVCDSGSSQVPALLLLLQRLKSHRANSKTESRSTPSLSKLITSGISLQLYKANK